MQSSENVLSLLRQVSSLRFAAKSEANTGWQGVGSGKVVVSEPMPKTVVFHETGTWQPSAEHQGVFDFSNVFRWSAVGEHLRLEHLRFGVDNPVLLFDMARHANGIWRDVSPHECGADLYAATLEIAGGKDEARRIVVAWSIIGPRKQETIEYCYQTDA
ncbi:DUF6314 family protein [Vreelandella aquamarina]